jgi:hypothetical protein
MNYICHSGGCDGADMEWENTGKQYGVKTISYSFWNHKQSGENQKILTVDELKEGFEHVIIASKTIKRNPNHPYQYVKNLLSRNWYQVKNAESIFAIGKFLNKSMVAGGTGWAVQMAIDNEKPVFFFDQENNIWNKYIHEIKEFKPLQVMPILTENFAGIGTRELNKYGINAIKDIYRDNFKNQ